jgi:predicted GNAT family acetyltransferase
VDAVADEPRYSVQLRPSALPALGGRYRTSSLKRMWRMRLAPQDFRPVDLVDVECLQPEDMSRLEELYRDGAAAGEAPEFFFSEMVTNGVFFGCCSADGRLAAVAGTHLAEPAEGVGAIGNVYTRRDCRGQGLAARVTSAVAAELLARSIGVIALNVYQSNAAAIRVYERLGFRRHCEYVEGIIERYG